MPLESGSPELDAAMDAWTSATASLPETFFVELRETLDAVARGEVAMIWDAPVDGHTAFGQRFSHPFAKVLDRVLFREALTLGLRGPRVQMPPMVGLILHKNLGTSMRQPSPASSNGPDRDSPEGADELARLREVLRAVTPDRAGGSTDHA